MTLSPDLDDDNQASQPLGLRWCRPITNRVEKEEIAARVASFAKDGEVIGAGSGSTSFLTVLQIGQMVADGLEVTLVPTSLEIELACHAAGVPVAPSVPTRIDWCFDGADEVDAQGRLIKGRGGAVHREREVFAVASQRFVVADETKSVEELGSRFAVPVEVDPRMVWVVQDHLKRIEHVETAELRLALSKDGPVITEGGQLLFDVVMNQIDDLDEQRLLQVPGVCCTGIFSGFSFDRITS